MRTQWHRAIVVLFAAALGLVLAAGPLPGRADDSAPPAGYRLVMTVSADGVFSQAYRLKTDTGEVCFPTHVKGDLNTWTWNKLAESDAPPAGDYDLQVRTTGPGTTPVDNVIRIERRSGRAWILVSSTWRAIAEPK